jgi:hypothetical protein
MRLGSGGIGKLALGAIAAVLSVALASAAGAAQRYAAPEGKGSEPCAKEAPCSLKDAVVGAKLEDEVILTGGSYTVPAKIANNVKNLNVHGDFGGTMPRINASVPSGPPLELGEGARVAYLEVFNTAGEYAYGFVCNQGWRIERVRVQVLSGNNGTGIFQIEGCQVRDSVIRVQGPNSRGIYAISNATDPVDRNLTVIATGTEAYGVYATPGAGAVDLRNTILSGEAADLQLSTKGRAFVGNSSFDSSKLEPEALLIDLGGNQTAPPQFVDASKGDYHEAAGSPTIDAGAVDQLGALDLDGNPRALGSAPDIGAYEFVPPIPVPEVGRLDSLAVRPGKFRAGNVAGALASDSHKKKRKAPLGATVTYSLSAAATVEFHVEHGGTGRRVGKDCVKQNASNKRHRKCVIYKPLKTSFSVPGAAGADSFRFSGKIDGKALKPGPYRLVGHAGDAIRRAPFTIVR